MKRAAIVVGKQNSGKSTTIRKFKTRVKMVGRNRFELNGKHGFILSTSFEEKNRPVEATIKRLSRYDLLVLACQGGRLPKIHSALRKVRFVFRDIQISLPHEASKKATEVFKFLKTN